MGNETFIKFQEKDGRTITINPSQWGGVEVYEGDILKTWIGGYEQASPYVVEDMRKLYFELERDDSYYRIQKTEIIGNIYENPELLEEEE